MVYLVAGLFIFCLVGYLVFMIVLPEWVGISKKDDGSEAAPPPSSDVK